MNKKVKLFAPKPLKAYKNFKGVTLNDTVTDFDFDKEIKKTPMSENIKYSKKKLPIDEELKFSLLEFGAKHKQEYHTENNHCYSFDEEDPENGREEIALILKRNYSTNGESERSEGFELKSIGQRRSFNVQRSSNPFEKNFEDLTTDDYVSAFDSSLIRKSQSINDYK